ncbi:MAG: Asp-tRNA(Asn)/Glu-tRNA(Gln) amidotransferase subunit GatA, partial [Alphaproteobacteria bacterium]|nr:Asp-tRNA(Asn)/Glu-tRNA(Gln) amidotransferase subunit GatA [Alphaproteobacteria bacterium]
ARTGMDALAMGVQTDTGVHGAVGHPADPGLVPGGSSGGSAVAVARGLFDVALGSDTGGSVRLPAALCGVVGLRPTWGRVSRDGLVPLASSMDTVGVLAREVGTVATVLQVLAGPSPRDATARARPLPWGRRAVTGLRVGLPRAWWSTDLDPRVREAASDAVAALRDAGALPVAMDVAGLDGAGAVYAAWVAVEAASDLARYDGRRLGTARGDVETVRGRVFGDEAVRRVVVGHALTDPSWSATWARARQARAALGACLATALADVHVLLGPASASPAWRRGQRTGPLQHATTDRLLAPASLAGLPAVSVPAGTASGLPVGVQVVGRAWDEATVLSVAAALEDALR